MVSNILQSNHSPTEGDLSLDERSFTVKSWRIITDPANEKYFVRNLKPESYRILQDVRTDLLRFHQFLEGNIMKMSKEKAKANWDIRALVCQRVLPPEYQEPDLSEEEFDSWTSVFETGRGTQVNTPSPQSSEYPTQQIIPAETPPQREEDLTPLQILGSVSPRMKYLLDKIQEKRSNIKMPDDDLKDLLSEVRAVGSKWANNERIGQAELYEAMDSVLTALKNYTEHSQPFLIKVSKREAPDYATIISKPMDLGTIGKKMKNYLYNSKQDFAEDLYLIYSNCLKYNTNPDNIYRTHAIAMQKKTVILLRSVPDIVIRDRSEVDRRGDDNRNGIEQTQEENIHQESHVDTGKSVRRFGDRKIVITVDEEEDNESRVEMDITEQDAEGTTDDEVEYDDYEPTDLIPQLKLPKLPDLWDPIGDKELRERMFDEEYTMSVKQPSLDAYSSARIPTRGTGALIDRNIELLKKSRKVHAKLGALKQGQPINPATILNHPEPASERSKTESLNIPEEDLPPLVMNNELSHACMTRVVAKLLTHAGFEAGQSSALQVLTDVAADYFLNLGKTVRSYLDDYDKGMTSEEIIQHSLFENGVPGVNTLETYVKDEVERYGAKLADINRRLETTYHDTLMGNRDGEIRNKSFSEDEEAFTTGNFTEALGEDFDFFGLKEMGLPHKVPYELFRPKSKVEMQSKAGPGEGKEAPAYPTPPPWSPVSDLKTQIGLLQPFFTKKLEETGGHLIEDEFLPQKQRIQRPKVPITGIIPRQPKNKKPNKPPAQTDNANKEKKRKREADAALTAEREAKRRLKEEEKKERDKAKDENRKKKEAEKKEKKEKAAKKAAQKGKSKKARSSKVPDISPSIVDSIEEVAEEDTETMPLHRRLKHKKRSRADDPGEGSSKGA
ncbi:hypothetical protein G9A89_013674 [Geosiphon pyriformis]|nr:hypothetical protein G9A89_013674 [Geosiphon pyriformis]